jgi:hypothetical protein
MERWAIAFAQTHATMVTTTAIASCSMKALSLRASWKSLTPTPMPKSEDQKPAPYTEAELARFVSVDNEWVRERISNPDFVDALDGVFHRLLATIEARDASLSEKDQKITALEQELSVAGGSTEDAAHFQQSLCAEHYEEYDYLDGRKKEEIRCVICDIEAKDKQIAELKDVIEWLAPKVTCDCGHGKSCPYEAVTAYQGEDGTNWVLCAHCITHCSGLPPDKRFSKSVQQCEPERDWCDCRALHPITTKDE